MRDVLDEVAIEVTPSNKKQIDRTVHQIVGVTYKNCPKTWKRLKQQITVDEQKRRDFINKLQDTIR